MRRRWFRNGVLPLLGLLTCAVLGTPAAAQEGSGGLQGRVVDEKGRPIAGVEAVLSGEDNRVRRSVAGEEATFRFRSVPAGEYRLLVRLPGVEGVEQRVVVAPGETRSVEVTLPASPIALQGIVVSATRTSELLRDVPSSVTVVTPAELGAQSVVTSDLGAILAQSVPGLAPGSGSLSNYGQNLRGRDVHFLIDGVPQTTPLRNASRWMRTIDPSAIERVEVIRGPSALYGYGATGGVVNVITRRPREFGTRFLTEVGARAGARRFDDTFQGRLSQQVASRTGRLDFLVNGSFERWGQFHDAEGDLIPQDPQGQGGLAGANEYNLLARFGVELSPQQRVDVSANYYDFKQELRYRTAWREGDRKPTAVRDDSIPGLDPGTENLVLTLGYAHEGAWGSRVSVRGYLQDYATRFTFYPGHPGGGGQGYVDSEKLGMRADVESPLPVWPGAEVSWGVDLLRDRTAQPLVDGRVYVPEMELASAAPFAQLELPLGGRVLLRGGVRYENLRLDVDDYTTLYVTDTVQGGVLRYDALLANVGAVVRLAPALDLFGSYAQGFSVADVGRVLRDPRAGVSSVEQLRPEPQTVNSYELGVRGGGERAHGALSAFVNTSELGSTFTDDPATPELELWIDRAPERVWGMEADLEVRPAPRMALGGSLTYVEGKRDTDRDGEYDAYLPGDRIQPLKLTGYVTYTPRAGWENRLQVLYSGERDRFSGTPDEKKFSYGAVESYATVDLASTLAMGPGTVSVGVQNLLNEFYYPAVAQWYNHPTARVAAPGRSVSIGYSVQY